ncbi:MAG: Rrf2 family transcriptional regulator [Candidatus Fournierella pullistercoris]|uniref:Rrf2 family transcriptional regulator n=1 Tax=Candidatus Allofournierella pullistercoris TaxID=2838597 RepID=A0A948T212_9FIRM|nr:Rrf2 family transcriptional regulator [Candidatus Fournierella pullistercoris]
MMISTKGRYALRVMLDLANNPDEDYVSLNGIAQRQGISMKYLEAIVAVLNKSGFLESRRGKTGGYRLAKPADSYSVRSILQAAEGELMPVNCRGCADGTCPRADQCNTLPLWQKLEGLIGGFLESITLQDLVDGNLPDSLV